MSNEQKQNTEMQKTLIICSIISMIIIIILVIAIIIYCICKNKREKNKLNNAIFIEGQNVKNNNQNNNKLFHSIPNNSSIGNNTLKTNFSLSEIKEKNLKEEIHNIIHSANSNSSSDGDRKKRKKKSGKKVIEVIKVMIVLLQEKIL